MRKRLKQVMLALMVGVGMMGAVGVQAQEKVWVDKGWSIDSTTGVSGTVDEICEAGIPARLQLYNEKYNGISYLSSEFSDGKAQISCGTEGDKINIFIDGNGMRFWPVVVSCDGGWSVKQLTSDGAKCYEQSNKCPEGTVKGEGNVCVDPCEEARRKGGDQGDDAGVLCDGTICFWPQNISGWDDMTEQHQDIIRDCTKRHEQVHRDQDREGCYRSECKDGDGRRGAIDFIHGWYRERDAHQDTETCYRDALFDDACEGNQACMDDIGQRRTNSDNEAKKMQGLIDQLPSESRLCE